MSPEENFPIEIEPENPLKPTEEPGEEENPLKPTEEAASAPPWRRNLEGDESNG